MPLSIFGCMFTLFSHPAPRAEIRPARPLGAARERRTEPPLRILTITSAAPVSGVAPEVAPLPVPATAVEAPPAEPASFATTALEAAPLPDPMPLEEEGRILLSGAAPILVDILPEELVDEPPTAQADGAAAADAVAAVAAQAPASEPAASAPEALATEAPALETTGVDDASSLPREAAEPAEPPALAMDLASDPLALPAPAAEATAPLEPQGSETEPLAPQSTASPAGELELPAGLVVDLADAAEALSALATAPTLPASEHAAIEAILEEAAEMLATPAAAALLRSMGRGRPQLPLSSRLYEVQRSNRSRPVRLRARTRIVIGEAQEAPASRPSGKPRRLPAPVLAAVKAKRLAPDNLATAA